MAICAVTQIASAAYTVRTLPRSAAVYIGCQAIGLSLGLAQLGSLQAGAAMAVLLAASALLVRMAYTACDMFVTRILSDRELGAAVRTVKLLLNEYEESGSDWLFELDCDGCLHDVSTRFASALGEPATTLEGRPFETLFAEGTGREILIGAIAERHPLRGEAFALATTADGEASRWWSVSGRPCYFSAEDRVAFRGVISDVTNQRLAESRVHHMAHFDSLTGLPNRTLFNQTLAELLDEREDEAQLALLLVDADRFKTVNDMYGHPAGDAFLRAMAERMSTVLCDSGLGGDQQLIARLGGDEFAIVIAGEDACDKAIRLAERLVAAMGESFAFEGHELTAGVSIGIALAPYHAALKQQLLSNADIALYAAKNNGRGTWEMFEPGMDAALHERHTLSRDLRHAVGNGELRLYLQPLVDVETEEMTGYEALLRWQHPERGLIKPNNFIPLAEETGLIVPIGEWVIRTAFDEAASWDSDQTIAINLSPVQLGSPNLLPVIVNALASSGLDPARIEFEITESVLLHNSDANIEILNRLHELGLKVALDDFGTGYASLNYLLTFPFDKIKIDRRFVSEIGTREASNAIVGAVIELANKLGMCTLAEGVEEPEQLARLKEQGCRMVQGWLFGKALPSTDYHPHTSPVVRVVPPATALKTPRKSARSQSYSRRAAG
ncbi:MAG TPA: EAL domain-containing protein [Novosphingobium sp.]|nr:EAL domain-containing protein [Novosphingobium sp.]